MTAATLAHAVRDSAATSLEPLVEQIVCTIRSQFAAALGNVGMVIPTVLVLNMAIFLWQGTHFLDLEKSKYVMGSLHPWESAALLYAAFTGAILWFASVCGGWVLNWVVFRRLPEAIAHHRRLIQILGRERTERLSLAFSKNISGISVNVVLGTMLAMIPIFSQFIGVPLQVRHVTPRPRSLAHPDAGSLSTLFEHTIGFFSCSARGYNYRLKLR
jgi:site-specific recombinase